MFTTTTLLKQSCPSIITLKGATRNTTCIYKNLPSLISLKYVQSFSNKDTSNIIYQDFPPCTHFKDKLFEHLYKQPSQSLVSRNSYSFWKKNDIPPGKRRVPILILVQNPLTWFMIKIDFSVLRNIWDPSFEVDEFKFGTKQAVSRVTQLISGGQFSDLNGLLTKAARLSLMRELDRNWNDKKRSLLALEKDDIQISAPRRVYFIRIADKKFCDVDMAFLALKWAPINTIEALLFTEIFARFHREYTPHCIPEWTIAYFKVTRFQILTIIPPSLRLYKQFDKEWLRILTEISNYPDVKNNTLVYWILDIIGYWII